MHQQYNANFPDDFPQILQESAHSLLNLRIEAYVWKYKEIKKVIDFLVKKQYLILGGDVYTKLSGGMTLTYDNWYLKDPDPKPLHERSEVDSKRILEMGGEQALAYVENYWKMNGDNYYYSLIFSH